MRGVALQLSEDAGLIDGATPHDGDSTPRGSVGHDTRTADGSLDAAQLTAASKSAAAAARAPALFGAQHSQSPHSHESLHPHTTSRLTQGHRTAA